MLDSNKPIQFLIYNFRINKLPNEEIIDYNVEEQELISNYVDPILSPILHQPERDKLFLW